MKNYVIIVLLASVLPMCKPKTPNKQDKTTPSTGIKNNLSEISHKENEVNESTIKPLLPVVENKAVPNEQPAVSQPIEAALNHTTDNNNSKQEKGLKYDNQAPNNQNTENNEVNNPKLEIKDQEILNNYYLNNIKAIRKALHLYENKYSDSIEVKLESVQDLRDIIVDAIILVQNKINGSEATSPYYTPKQIESIQTSVKLALRRLFLRTEDNNNFISIIEKYNLAYLLNNSLKEDNLRSNGWI